MAQGVVDGFFKGKGNLDIAISGTYQHSNRFYAGTNLFNYQRKVTSFGLFAEYGILKRWDVIANIPLVNYQFQDAAVFTKFELIRKKVGKGTISVIPAVGVSFPLSNYQTESGQAIGQQATQIQPRLVVQHAFGNGMFVQVQSGYNYALDPVTSSIPFSIKWGVSFDKNYVDVWCDHQTGFGNKDYQGNVPFGSLRELVVSYNRIGGVFYRQLNKRIGVFGNLAYTLNGRNTSKSVSVGGGMVLKLKFLKEQRKK